MGAKIGGMFGKFDKDATSDVDSTGQVVATGTPGAKTVADPSGGLSSGQVGLRKGLARGLSGIGSGLQSTSAQPRPGGGAPMPVAAQPQIADDGGAGYDDYLQRMRMQGGQGMMNPNLFYGS